jgi:hypothetical protein
MRRASLGFSALLLAIARPGVLPAQQEDAVIDAPRPVGFPVSVSASLGFSSYGNRATQTTTRPLDSSEVELAYALSNGPALVARAQAPLGRLFGLVLGAGVSWRSRRLTEDGEPQSTPPGHVLSVRGEGGLLFRFKPAAPIYFAGVVSYVRHSQSPVENQPGSPAEMGGGVGVGYEFARRPGSNLSARVEWWNYWIKPKAEGLPGGYVARSLAHDGMLAFSLVYRLGLRPRRP